MTSAHRLPSAAEPAVVFLQHADVDAAIEALVVDVETVFQKGLTRWVLAADASLGAVAAEVAERVLDGNVPVFGLAGVILTGADAGPDSDADAEIADFVGRVASGGPAVPASTARLIASSRTSSRTRGILARRALPDDPDYRPTCLTPGQLTTLRAVADRVVPQDGPTIDLAARLDAELTRGEGDGWRNAELPSDAESYALALTTLQGFQDLDPADQDARLTAVAAAEPATEPAASEPAAAKTETEPAAGLTPSQLALWFEDACAALTRIWLAHPATLARADFDGFAIGGDVTPLGFRVLGAGLRESWEPGSDLLQTPERAS